VLNRAVLIVRPGQPFLDWAAQPDDSGVIPRVDGEQTAYLIPKCGDDVTMQSLVRSRHGIDMASKRSMKRCASGAKSMASHWFANSAIRPDHAVDRPARLGLQPSRPWVTSLSDARCPRRANPHRAT
jgi:hypothetical protein